jgi:pimeloyl-ACP methyl ester carboxylesterase
MDYHDSSAGTATLAVVKYAATAMTKQGTLFFNPGGPSAGPGGSGLKAMTEIGPMFSQGTEGGFDIISWDPRGVGQTFPGDVTCFNSKDEDDAFWQNTVVRYINETISGKFNEQDRNELYSQVAPTEKKFQDFGQNCRSGPVGPHLPYIGTSSTVRDLVSLGNAIVGTNGSINFWGLGYGTVVGFNFLNMFPERAGHMILDGVVDPTTWISYKFLRPSLVDTEETCFGMADACIAGGSAGCKLMNFIGDDGDRNDIAALLNGAHDLALKLSRMGIKVPAPPGAMKEVIFGLLHTPTAWAEHCNGDVYDLIRDIHKIARANNVTLEGGPVINIPPETSNTGRSLLRRISGRAPGALVSYSSAAIAGADNFNDASATVSNVFDMIVENTRDITPTFGTVWADGYTSYGWPVRSVEQLTPYTPKELAHPVLLIGNTADPITPYANAQNTAALLGDNAYLLEQVGFGHSSVAQASTCTMGVMLNYLSSSTLPSGRTSQCPVDNTVLFPPLGTTVTKRANFMRKWGR